MRYVDFVEALSGDSGVPPEQVRAVLDVFRACLLRIPTGESLRVPFGTFVCKIYDARPHNLYGTGEVTWTPPRVQVYMKRSWELLREVVDTPNGIQLVPPVHRRDRGKKAQEAKKAREVEKRKAQGPPRVRPGPKKKPPTATGR